MILKSLDSTYLITHRYGWNKIIAELYKNCKEIDITLVHFMDKYFNAWFDQDKIIEWNDTNLYFKNKDTYYNISKDEDNFIFFKENGLYYVIRWDSVYNEFKLVRGALIQFYKKKYNVESIKSPWYGILHYPEFTKEMNFSSLESSNNIVNSDTFIESKKYCKGIIVLSNHCKQYLSNIIPDIPVHVVYHPTDTECNQFNMKLFINNKNKKLIQLGYWMRKHDTIYKIKCPEYLTKYWLPGGYYWKEMTYNIYGKEAADNMLNSSDVIIKMYLSDEAYDELLTCNIGIVDVFNSSANNSILECISRATPIFAKYHPAIIEYLGNNYPLYFNTIEDINNLLNSENLFSYINDSVIYLKSLDLHKFKISTFINSVKNIINS